MSVESSSSKLDYRKSSAISVGSRLAASSSNSLQVITLTALSEQIPLSFIGEAVWQEVHSQTGRSILFVEVQAGEAKIPMNLWTRVRARLNGESGFASQIESAGPGLARLRLQVSSDATELRQLSSMLRHLESHFDYVILAASVDLPVPILLECFVQSDRSFLLLQPLGEHFYHRDLLMREARSHPCRERLNLRSIVCREMGEGQGNELLQGVGASVHGYLQGCPKVSLIRGLRRWPHPAFNADIRRLAREIGRCRVGLALSSGGARGLAHIGVIQVLEENGLEIDMVAGCSMGAYVGSVWAYGYDGETMEKLAREVEHRWGLLQLIDPFILPRQGFLRGEKVKRRLKRSIGDVHFSELVRPLRVVATNLSTLERTIFSSGEVASAVHASSAIPGACVPVRIGEELYVDGGIADPLPVDVLSEMGIERIIAVNTIPTPAYLRCRREMEREQAEMSGKRSWRIRTLLNQYLNYFAPGNILDTILRSIHGAQMRIAEHACGRADIVLRPLSFDGRWHDFRNPGKYIALGRKEALEHLDEIKALVKRQHHNENQSAHDTVATVA